MAQYAEMNVDDTHSFLGLETYLSNATTREIRHQRRALQEAVLAEQQRQIDVGIFDPEMLASVSEGRSEWCRTRSHIIGLIHAEEK